MAQLFSHQRTNKFNRSPENFRHFILCRETNKMKFVCVILSILLVGSCSAQKTCLSDTSSKIIDGAQAYFSKEIKSQATQAMVLSVFRNTIMPVFQVSNGGQECSPLTKKSLKSFVSSMLTQMRMEDSAIKACQDYIGQNLQPEKVCFDVSMDDAVDDIRQSTLDGGADYYTDVDLLARNVLQLLLDENKDGMCAKSKLPNIDQLKNEMKAQLTKIGYKGLDMYIPLSAMYKYFPVSS